MADTDCDDTTPCWCGEPSPLYDDEGLDDTCGGLGSLTCHCGGDLCVCHHHGEVECPGCPDCDERLEGDDEGAFEYDDEEAYDLDGDDPAGDRAACPCHPPTCPSCGSELQGWTCDGREGSGACWEHGTVRAPHNEDDGGRHGREEREAPGVPWCKDCGEQGHATCGGIA